MEQGAPSITVMTGICTQTDCERESVSNSCMCVFHGGLKQCYLCDKWAIRGGKCKKHAIIAGLFESNPPTTLFRIARCSVG